MLSQSLHIEALKECISRNLESTSQALKEKQRVVIATNDEATTMTFHPPIAAALLLGTLEQCRL